MAGESPAAVIVDGVNGVEVAVVDGLPIPINTRALLIAGKDGSGDAQIFLLDANGNLVAAPPAPTTAATTGVSQSITTVTLLLANAARKGAIVVNNAVDKLLYVKLGASASTIDWGVRLLPGGAFVLPYPAYTGLITGVWSGAGSGSARITETT